MARALSELAAFGGMPAFPEPLHVAQLYLPAFERVETAFRGIFARRYFTNNGPLVREFEQKLSVALGVPHVVCTTNGTIALMMMAKAACASGEVIVPAFTFPATAQALTWAGFTPVLCDVDPSSHMLTEELVAPLLTARTTAILGVHLWGNHCGPLDDLARKAGVNLLYDACHAMGCTENGRSMAAIGDAAALSFHATKVVSAAEGGCVATADAAMAAQLREIRGYYSPDLANPIARMNGRMSEAQAAFGLLSLEDLPANIAANKARYESFAAGLAGIPGVSVLPLTAGNNFQYVVLDIDEGACGLSRDRLMRLMSAENVFCRRHFFPGLHRLGPYASTRRFPNTDRLCGRLLQLPSGAAVTADAARRICSLIADIVRLAPAIGSGE